MNIHGLFFLEVRRSPVSQGFVVKICEERNEPTRSEAFDTEELLLEYLSTFALQRLTPEQILEQLLLPAEPEMSHTQIQVLARDTTPVTY
jgi:hypothetical protein